MKLNKKQKELILSKIDLSLEIVDGIEYLYWNAGEASYNIGMKPTWSKEQKEYLDGMEDRLNKRIDSVQSDIKTVIEILARNGMK